MLMERPPAMPAGMFGERVVGRALDPRKHMRGRHRPALSMTLASTTDTIIALATGSGRARIAVVRVSGPGVLGVLAHFRSTKPPEPRRAAMSPSSGRRRRRSSTKPSSSGCRAPTPTPARTWSSSTSMAVTAVVESGTRLSVEFRLCRVAEARRVYAPRFRCRPPRSHPGRGDRRPDRRRDRRTAPPGRALFTKEVRLKIFENWRGL